MLKDLVTAENGIRIATLNVNALIKASQVARALSRICLSTSSRSRRLAIPLAKLLGCSALGMRVAVELRPMTDRTRFI